MPMLLCLECAVLFCPTLLCLSVHLDVVWDISIPSQISNAITTPQLSLPTWCRYNTGKITQHRACLCLSYMKMSHSYPNPLQLTWYFVSVLHNEFICITITVSQSHDIHNNEFYFRGLHPVACIDFSNDIFYWKICHDDGNSIPLIHYTLLYFKMFLIINQSMKILVDNEKNVKVSLKRFLYHHTFCSMQEYYQHMENKWTASVISNSMYNVFILYIYWWYGLCIRLKVEW
jgi:hypothetical protein